MPVRGLSGISYDFGVQIARGTVRELVKTVAGVTALTGAVVTLVQATDELDETFQANQIAFGGYANTIKALNFASNQVAKGIGFNTNDLMTGMKLLNRSGLNAKNNLQLVSDAAKATGNSFSDIAKIINSGDFGALSDMGIITQRTADSMQRFGFNTYQASRQVKALLDEANKRGLFKNSVQTMEQIMTRFRQFKNDFVQGIVGDPKDPEGLAFNVKKYMTQLADFINKHRNRIIFWGKAIGRTLRFVIDVVGDFMKRVFRNLGDMMGLQQKSTQVMKDQLMSFGLWLEIQRARINNFFDKYGDMIWKIIKLILIYNRTKWAMNIFGNAISSGARFLRVLRVIALRNNLIAKSMRWIKSFDAGVDGSQALAGSVGDVREGLKGVVKNATGMVGTFVRSIPVIGLVAGAVVGVGVAIKKGIIDRWDEIRYMSENTQDSWWDLLNPLKTIAKYWDEIKAVGNNTWVSIKYSFKTMWTHLQTMFDNMKHEFNMIFIQIKRATGGVIDLVNEYKPNLAPDRKLQGAFNSAIDSSGLMANASIKASNQAEIDRSLGLIQQRMAEGMADGMKGSALAKLQKDLIQEQVTRMREVLKISNADAASIKTSSQVATQSAAGRTARSAAYSGVKLGVAGWGATTLPASKQKILDDYNSGKTIDYGTGSSGGSSASNGGTVYNYQGAVTIQLNGGNLSADEIANKVLQKIKSLDKKNMVREGN